MKSHFFDKSLAGVYDAVGGIEAFRHISKRFHHKIEQDSILRGFFPKNMASLEERLALYLQNKESVYELAYNDEFTYGDIFLANEQQFSAFELEVADVEVFKRHFEDMEREVPRILGERGRKGEQLVLPAYDHVLKASHLFNIMDARGAIAVAERQSYIGRIRDLCRQCAEVYVAQQGGNA